MHSPILLVGGDLDLFRAKAKKEVGAWSISRKNVRNERISDGRACQGPLLNSAPPTRAKVLNRSFM